MRTKYFYYLNIIIIIIIIIILLMIFKKYSKLKKWTQSIIKEWNT